MVAHLSWLIKIVTKRHEVLRRWYPLYLPDFRKVTKNKNSALGVNEFIKNHALEWIVAIHGFRDSVLVRKLRLSLGMQKLSAKRGVLVMLLKRCYVHQICIFISLFFYHFAVTWKKKHDNRRKSYREMFLYEISIIIISICRKLGSVSPMKQKIKLRSPNSSPQAKWYVKKII